MTHPPEDNSAAAGAPAPPAGWYPDPSTGRSRWWDGRAWGPYAPLPPAPAVGAPGVPAAGMFGTGVLGAGAPSTEAPWDDARERTWSMWSHLGPLLAGLGGLVLSAGVLSVFAFLVPLVIMNTHGDRSARVRTHAVESLNFQLSMLLYAVVTTVVMVVAAVATLGLGLVVVVPVLLALGLFALVVMILAVTKASRGEFFHYPLSIPFVR